MKNTPTLHRKNKVSHWQVRADEIITERQTLCNRQVSRRRRNRHLQSGELSNTLLRVLDVLGQREEDRAVIAAIDAPVQRQHFVKPGRVRAGKWWQQ